MSQKFNKLVTLLKELFQLDQPDLDFGLYRIMHAKSGEITQFLETDLLPQVHAAFGKYQTGDKAELEKELAKVIAGVEAAGMNADDAPKVKELRAKIAEDAVDVAALESEVYDHLYSFFRRYYHEGDFLSKRVYKQGVYAIPYEGEEVKLHWANKDQYYIKTSEYLRDYAFRLRAEDDANPMRVHFKLVDASEGEHGNVKATEGKDRVFILAPAGESGHDYLSIENDELSIAFEYRPAAMDDWTEETKAAATAAAKKKPPVQSVLLAQAAKAILEVTHADFRDWIAELNRKHIKADGEQADYSRLEAHLRRYSARNTFDYFIHKDLGGFLKRELDFYIKNEVMHLDDIENETITRAEQYLSKIKVIRKIAGKIITFLAQLEDFQKKLWLKKKFVVETNYCITLDRIPEEFYPEIAANDAQREEWVKLFAIDEIEASTVSPAYSEPLTVEFLKANKSLILDTCFFPQALANSILGLFDEYDEQSGGCLIHSENYQALSTIGIRFKNKVDVIYIDPPYNTGKGDFHYKDSYMRSSWATMMHDRLELAKNLLKESGKLTCSIADHEIGRIKLLLEEIFKPTNFLANFIWNNEGNIDNQSKVKVNHEYLISYCKNEKKFSHPQIIAPDIGPDSKLYNDTIENSITKNGPANPASEVILPVGFPAAFENGEISARNDEWPHLYDTVKVASYSLTEAARAFSGWSSRNLLDQFLANSCEPIMDAKGLKTWFKITHTGAIYSYKERMDQSHVLSIIRSVGTVKKMSGRLAEMGFDFTYPKPLDLIEYVCRFSNDPNSLICDFFAGSGTSANAVISLNRSLPESKRKFLVVEMGSYFDTIILPRTKKCIYSPKWKSMRPLSRDKGLSYIFKYIRLESYEDALNNLEPRRGDTQQDLLASAASQGEDGLKEQYMLRYMLDVETRESPSLLNIQAFSDPTAYKLKVKRPGSDESKDVNVDLLETFNYLIGLTVEHIAAPQVFSAEFDRDAEQRLKINDRLRQDAEGPYWFRTVTGTTPDGQKTLVIWRKLTGTPEEDNLVLDEWFTRQGYSTKDSEFQLIYVNGDCTLENLKTAEDTWKVRLLEEDFHRLMFDAEGM